MGTSADYTSEKPIAGIARVLWRENTAGNTFARLLQSDTGQPVVPNLISGDSGIDTKWLIIQIAGAQ